MKTLIGIQDEFIQAIVAATARWSHRRCAWDSSRIGGHYTRARRGARRKATKSLQALGFDDVSIEQIIKDADDVAKLEINAD
jgi:hypothetical protein